MTIKEFIEKYKFADFEFVDDFDKYNLECTPYYIEHYPGRFEERKIKIVFIDDNDDLTEHEIKKGEVKDYLNDNVIAIIKEYREDHLPNCGTDVIVRTNPYLSEEKYINLLRELLIEEIYRLSSYEIKDILKKLEEYR